jgi:hypothetical protein
MGLIPPDDMNRIIKKDYAMLLDFIAAFELFDEVDFDRWFTGLVRLVTFDNYL